MSNPLNLQIVDNHDSSVVGLDICDSGSYSDSPVRIRIYDDEGYFSIEECERIIECLQAHVQFNNKRAELVQFKDYRDRMLKMMDAQIADLEEELNG